MALWISSGELATSSTPPADQLEDHASVSLKAGRAAPFAGTLFSPLRTLEISSIIDNYSNMRSLMQLAKDEAKRERRRANRWYRRPSFWIPVACVTFTAGLFVGVWSD